MGRSYSTHGKVRDIHEILVERPNGKRPFGRPGRRFRTEKICWVGVDWIRQTQDRKRRQVLMGTVITVGLHKRREI